VSCRVGSVRVLLSSLSRVVVSDDQSALAMASEMHVHTGDDSVPRLTSLSPTQPPPSVNAGRQVPGVRGDLNCVQPRADGCPVLKLLAGSVPADGGQGPTHRGCVISPLLPSL
jgi:hypothetical protein